ncbi:unnamed protein product, partial [Meganyctiphanes norvegica]
MFDAKFHLHNFFRFIFFEYKHMISGCFKHQLNLFRDRGERAKNAVPGPTTVDREQWSRPIEFILSCLSMTVGLGNVWRFPSTALQNGGGAFLIPYLIVLVLISRPLYFMELAMGQFSSSGSVKVWKAVPAVKGIGFGQAFGNFLTISYYCSIISITVFYFIQSFSAALPWELCDASWATSDCVDLTTNMTALLNRTDQQQSSVEQFFYHHVLRYSNNIEDGIGIPNWKLSLCLLFCWTTLFFTLFKGVKTSGKVAYFTAIVPYLVLITLLIRGATLPGAYNGIMYFITPQWEKLLELKVWWNAINQSFFSLGVGFGNLVMLASYNDFKHDIYRWSWDNKILGFWINLFIGATMNPLSNHQNYYNQLNPNVHLNVITSKKKLFCVISIEIYLMWCLPSVISIDIYLMLCLPSVINSKCDLYQDLLDMFNEFARSNFSEICLPVCLWSFKAIISCFNADGQWVVESFTFREGSIEFMLKVLTAVICNWFCGASSFSQEI